MAQLWVACAAAALFLTGSSSPAVSAEAKRDRLGLLHKPVSPDQLVAAVDRARAAS